MEINTLFAGHKYAINKPATRPDPTSNAGSSAFKAVENFADTLKQTETLAAQSMTKGADPQALVQALAQTELAVETVVSMRDKVVQAYQEILRMPM